METENTQDDWLSSLGPVTFLSRIPNSNPSMIHEYTEGAKAILRLLRRTQHPLKIEVIVNKYSSEIYLIKGQWIDAEMGMLPLYPSIEGTIWRI